MIGAFAGGAILYAGSVLQNRRCDFVQWQSVILTRDIKEINGRGDRI